MKMLSITAMLALAGSAASYSLVKNYTAENWMESFTVLDNVDPTGGFVNYLSDSAAKSAGLYKTIGGQVYIGVDNTTTLSSSGVGRNSVKIVGNDVYNHAVMVADFEHVPASACGSWPAFWMNGNGTWPASGEIDIMEGINHQQQAQSSIHTSPGCNVTVEATYGQLGKSGSNSDCGIGGGYDGCTVFSSSSKSYGDGFNAAGGGVYGLHWNGNEIKVWFFSRANIPADIKSGNPNPNVWGTPQASWAGCAFDDYFKNMSFLFNTDFCGTWAGLQWGASSYCSPKAATCNDYVAANPSAFSESYWLINYVKVFTG